MVFMIFSSYIALFLILIFSFSSCDKNKRSKNNDQNKSDIIKNDSIKINSKDSLNILAGVVKRNYIDNFDSSSELFIKIKNAMNRNSYFRHNIKSIYGSNVYKYCDFYVIEDKVNCVKGIFNSYLFYKPVIDTIMFASDQEAYNYYNKLNINSINETQELLEHILFIEESQGIIIDSWERLHSSYINFYPERIKNINIDSIKRSIHIEKPSIIEYHDYNKHIFYVYSRPCKGGTISIYQIKVKNNKIQGAFERIELYCFMNKCRRM